VTTGPSIVRGIRFDIATHLDWLEQERPEYLMLYPSILRELLELSAKRGTRPSGLREVRTFAEALPADIRPRCREVWNVPVADVYSADEVGYIALQCPEHEHYHVQSEGVLVEVLDEHNRPCEFGQVGRVVVTPLHNFAMPLVRYELGDYAEVGEPCDCGRGLPVLRRIMGRVRNMLVTASGERYWPAFGSRQFAEVAPTVRQHQFVQKSLDRIEARLVTTEPLTPELEAKLRKLVISVLPAGFHVDFVRCESISRSPSGKFEDFISEVAPRPVS
jgi:phenylacetate-CoA ligase